MTDLKQIDNPKGSISHLLKSTDESFSGFGEAYLSRVHCNTVKAWKRHKEMVMNLIVLNGTVRFVFYDSQGDCFKTIIVRAEDFKRITVPAMIWFGFQGIESSTSTILNLASIVHNPLEAETADINTYPFNWKR
jgi:dTDP-4-dehydrorhamnose 3,5-epimerase